MDPLTLLGTTALSGGLSFISGASQSRTTKAQNRINIWLAQQANEKAEALGRELLTLPMFDAEAFRNAGETLGYNPVTWLRSGAASMFQPRAQAEAAYRLMAPSHVAQVARVPSMAEAAANAGISALNTFTAGYKTMQSQDMQWQMLERQLQAMATGRPASPSGNFGSANPYVPNMLGISAGGPTSSTGGLSSKVSDLPYPSRWEAGKVEVTNPHSMWPVDSTVSDAETYETRYGDVFQELAGASNLFNDAVRAVSGRTLREWGIAAGVSLAPYAKGSNSMAETIGKWYADPNGFFNLGSRNAHAQKPVTPYMPFAGANAY